MDNRLSIRTVFLAVAFTFGWSSLGFAAQQLFRPSTEAVPPAGELGVMRSRAVKINFDELMATAMEFKGGEKPKSLELNLFPDRSFRAVLDSVSQEIPVNFSWIGRLEGVEDSKVVLVVGGGNVTGTVTAAGASYRIRSVGDVQLVQQIDPAAYPREAEPIPIPPTPGAPVADLSGAVDDGSTIDLLVVYNSAARQAAGGVAAIQNLITLGVAETNIAFSNSAIIPRINLVHVAEVGYVEANNINTDLSRLQSTADGFLDEVHALRDRYKADLVHLVVDRPAGGCGIGFLMRGSNNIDFSSWAFSITSQTCISPNYSFAHELGHNMGCDHAPEDPVDGGAFSYSFGYKDPLNRFRTVMAYDCATPCTRELYFSNPSVFFSGLPTGTATQNNAQSINNVRRLVANFRSSR